MTRLHQKAIARRRKAHRAHAISGAVLAILIARAETALAQTTLVEIGPTSSTLHPSDPDGASGGRINGLAAVASDRNVFYAATEWGGLYKSPNRGQTWTRLNGHQSTVTWDVAVSPADPNRVVATSFYDGRAVRRGAIAVSSDGGATWSHPPSALPVPADCEVAARSDEPSAFGISFDPDQPTRVYVGRSTAVSPRSKSLATWPMLRPPAWHSRTVSALNSSVNRLCFRFDMDHSTRALARFGVSTKPGQLHEEITRGCARSVD